MTQSPVLSPTAAPSAPRIAVYAHMTKVDEQPAAEVQASMALAMLSLYGTICVLTLLAGPLPVKNTSSQSSLPEGWHWVQ